MRKILFSSAIIALTASAALAQQPATQPTLYDRALAAGYKAQFICSGLFNGGKSLEHIEADELTGIYDRVADIVATLTADIDHENRRISVTYDQNSPPRMALWGARTGCMAMPIGFEGFGSATPVPQPQSAIPLDVPRLMNDTAAWPMGDENALAIRTQEVKPLDRAAGAAFRQGDNPWGKKAYGGKTSAVIVVQKDKIIWEAYKPGHDKHTAQRTWSVAKSIAGTLAGWQVQKGLASTNDKLALREYQGFGDPRASIRLDNVLRMASGLTSDTAGNRTDPIYLGGASVAQRTTSWPLLYKPGSRFRYANNDTLLAVLHLARRDDIFEPNELFFKLGMTRTYAETDWRGNYILSSQVWTSARDLARLGLLYLNDGMWPYGEEGPERLLPESWREYVSAPSGPQPNGRFGYGATFWLMNTSEGIPTDTIGAFGNRGQYLVIVPSRDIVIVRRGYDTRDDRFDIEAFTREILSSLSY